MVTIMKSEKRFQYCNIPGACFTNTSKCTGNSTKCIFGRVNWYLTSSTSSNNFSVGTHSIVILHQSPYTQKKIYPGTY